MCASHMTGWTPVWSGRGKSKKTAGTRKREVSLEEMYNLRETRAEVQGAPDT